MNFLQLERFGKFGEQTFRNQFEEKFDFLEFNKILVKEHCGKDLAIAFDPSYISKSGKKTPGVGYFGRAALAGQSGAWRFPVWRRSMLKTIPHFIWRQSKPLM